MIVRQLVAQGDPDGGSLAAEMAAALQGMEVDRLDVAVAYATRPGVAALRDAIGGWPAATRWVVGLDDAITQPAAIDDLTALPNAQLRLASLSSEGRRFHPKLYCLWSSADPAVCLTVIGSANMTLHGLNRNGEVGAVLAAENAAEATMLKHVWTQMNALGRDLQEWDLDAYRESHERARKARRRMAKIGAMPAHPEAEEEIDRLPAFNGDPATATLAWIDCGKAMGRGREVELHGDMMPFFGVAKGAPTPQEREFVFADGKPRTLPLKLWAAGKGNRMWRINFTSAIPGTDVLLRRVVNGKMLRSDKTAVFRKAGEGVYAVRFVTQATPAYDELVTNTEAHGLLGGTSARQFGFL